MNVDWPTRVRPPSLGEGVVHLWRVSLEAPDDSLPRLRESLDAHERSRADRFKFDRHRRRFLVGRAVLRQLLGLYVDVDPADLVFNYSGHGKPSLQPHQSHPTHLAGELTFNVSNSHELALYAFALDRRVGVDVEHLRPMPDALKLAARYFTAEETEALRTAPPGEDQVTFFRTWTRKEAVLKASGEGLSRPLNSFDISPPQTPLTIAVPDGRGELTSWRLLDLAPGGGYLGALAADGEPFEIAQFELPRDYPPGNDC